MKKGKKRDTTPDVVLVADLHLRESVPPCRTDDYWDTQWKKIRFLREHGVNRILCAGDVFDHWKPSPFLLSTYIKYGPSMAVIPGQHDLPNHSMELFPKSGLATLVEAEKIVIVPEEGWNLGTVGENDDIQVLVKGFPFGTDPQPCPKNLRKKSIRNVAMIHRLTHVSSKDKFQGMENAYTLMKKLDGYDLIVVGDNHRPFVIEEKGRILVSPGSMMRMSSDQVDHKPRMYLWYAEDNSIKPLFYPIERDVIAKTEEVKTKEEIDERIKTFVAKMGKIRMSGPTFQDKVKEVLLEMGGDVSDKVKNLVWQAIDLNAEEQGNET